MAPFLSLAVNASLGVSEPVCCPNVAGCELDPKNPTNQLADWCKVVDTPMNGDNFATEETASITDLYHCLSGCQLNPQCLFATFDSAKCAWFTHGRESQKEEKWVLVQTQQPANIPSTFGPGASGMVGLGFTESLAECKALFLEYYSNGSINSNFGRWYSQPDPAYSDGFTLSDTQSGKGAVKVIIAYKGYEGAMNTTDGLGVSATPGCQKAGVDYVLTYSNTEDTGVVTLEDKSTTSKPYLWDSTGNGLMTCNGECSGLETLACFSTSSGDAGKTDDQSAGFAPSPAPSNCASNADGTPNNAHWIMNFLGKGWGKKMFALGPCVETGEAVPMYYLGTPKQTVATCGQEVSCGLYSYELPSQSTKPGFQSADADPVDNCFGYNTPPPPPPPPPSPPTPTPTTCDSCNSTGLSCCGTGYHAFCYNEEYNECCPAPMWTEEFPVVVVCAKGQGCEPGCTPWPIATEGEVTDVMEEQQDRLKTVESVHADQGFERCEGLFGTFALCPDGMSCCGRNTLTPECYYEEYNECCQPEGSNYSVICGKHQGCAQTDNGVPYCVDAFEACRVCTPLFPAGFRSLMCHVHGSDTCFHAPDPVSCKQVGGDSATFCFGSDPIPTPGASDDLVFDLI